MTLTLILVLFLITAIVFGLDAILGYFAGETYGTRYHPRVWSACFCLWAICFLLWHAGK
jgi:hypothetical protein